MRNPCIKCVCSVTFTWDPVSRLYLRVNFMNFALLASSFNKHVWVFVLQTLLVDVVVAFEPNVMPYKHEFVQILIYRFGHQKGRLRTYPYLYTCICIKCRHVAFNIPFRLNVTCETQCHFLWHICIIIGKHSGHLWSGVEIDACNMGIITWDVATWESVPWDFVISQWHLNVI